MPKQNDKVEALAVVRETLPATTFKCELLDQNGEPNGTEVTAHLSGKMRKFRIRVMEGDTVKIELSIYELTKGRIVSRL